MGGKPSKQTSADRRLKASKGKAVKGKPSVPLTARFTAPTYSGGSNQPNG
jgi:hypothetical protein